MKTTKLIKLIAIAGLSLSAISPALAVDTAAKREIYNTNEGSVFGVKGILKITATIQGQVKNQEAQIWSNATCIGDGLLVAAYGSISPNVGGNMPNIEITKEIEGLKLINSAGEEFDAPLDGIVEKLVSHHDILRVSYIKQEDGGYSQVYRSSIHIPELRILDVNGLCGGFNSSIAKLARDKARELIASGKEVKMLCVGKKGAEVLRSEFDSIMMPTATVISTGWNCKYSSRKVACSVVQTAEKNTISNDERSKRSILPRINILHQIIQ